MHHIMFFILAFFFHWASSIWRWWDYPRTLFRADAKRNSISLYQHTPLKQRRTFRVLYLEPGIETNKTNDLEGELYGRIALQNLDHRCDPYDALSYC